MELKDAVYGRRSIRKYLNKPVPCELIREILEGACMAPSGINRQPWYFMAITDQKMREKYLGYMNETFVRFRPTLEKRFSRNPEVIEETGTFFNTMGGAPVVILVFLLNEELKESDNESTLIQGIGAAIQNLLLMAYDKGLACCWTTAPVVSGLAEEIRAEFAPDKGGLLAAVTLGYPDQAPKAPPRRAGRFDIV